MYFLKYNFLFFYVIETYRLIINMTSIVVYCLILIVFEVILGQLGPDINFSSHHTLDKLSRKSRADKNDIIEVKTIGPL